ncbi:hypothetical protein EBR16_08775 [bacterium]|nr:hypothetical protein [bacterium]
MSRSTLLVFAASRREGLPPATGVATAALLAAVVAGEDAEGAAEETRATARADHKARRRGDMFTS